MFPAALLTVGIHTDYNMGTWVVFTVAVDAVTLALCHVVLEKLLGKINNACH